jgi:hypothetical protein
MQGQIQVTLDPVTNDVEVRSNLDEANTVLLLARAHQVALNHASVLRPKIEVPSPESRKVLLNGHAAR